MLKDSLARAWRALIEKRASPLKALDRGVERFMPSDWLVVAVLGIIMFVSAGAMLATASLAFTIQVPAHGGTWTEGLVGSPRFVNPILAISETDRDLTQLVFSGLMKKNPDGTVSPDLAASYEISDDARTYTFTIRDDATFQNGDPVTAEDVAFTIEAAQNPEIKSPLRANWEGVTVAVEGEKTLSFTLKNPYAPFIENASVGILPQRLWQETSAEEFPFVTLNTEPIGSGPYAVERVRRSASGIPIEYRLKAFHAGARTPFIEQMVFRFYEGAEGLKGALIAGEIEAAHSVSPEGLPNSTILVETIFGRVFGVFFNQNQNQIFASKEVRAALDVVVDKQKIIDTILSGYGSAIGGPFPPPSVETPATDGRSPEERIEAARAILTEAGWKAGEDGIFEKKSKSGTARLSFSLSTASAPELKGAAEMVAADWRSLGADVELRFFEQNDLSTEVLRPRKYDALLFGLVVGEDADLFAFWHSSQRNDPGLNIALYASIDVDKKLENARTELDLTTRHEITMEAAETIEDEVAAVFLYTPHFVYLVPKSAQGISLGTVTNPSDRFLNVDQWYVAYERIWPFFTNPIINR